MYNKNHKKNLTYALFTIVYCALPFLQAVETPGQLGSPAEQNRNIIPSNLPAGLEVQDASNFSNSNKANGPGGQAGDIEFNAVSSKNPFKPPVYQLGEEIRPQLKIQSYQLGDFRLIATLWKGGRRRALVQTPDNEVLTLYKGDKLANGYIGEIREKEIIVFEVFVEPGKKYSYNVRRLKFQENTQ